MSFYGRLSEASLVRDNVENGFESMSAKKELSSQMKKTTMPIYEEMSRRLRECERVHEFE